jgi:hypothetical protein
MELLAREIVGRRLGHFDRAVLQGIHHAEGGHQFTGSMHGHLELAARKRTHRLGEHFGAAENGVQRFGEAGSKTPAHGGLGVDGGGDACGEHTCNTSVLDDGTTIHEVLSRMMITRSFQPPQRHGPELRVSRGDCRKLRGHLLRVIPRKYPPCYPAFRVLQAWAIPAVPRT